MGLRIDTEKIYCSQVEVISVVDIKVRAIDINDNIKEQVISLDLYDYQDIEEGTDIVSDCVGRVELSLEKMDSDLTQYIKYGKTDLNYIGFIHEILEALGESEYKEVRITDIVDVKFKFEPFEMILDK